MKIVLKSCWNNNWKKNGGQKSYCFVSILFCCLFFKLKLILFYNRVVYLCKGSLTGWRHKILWHCRRCTARGHISPIHVDNLLRLWVWTSIDLMKENDFVLAKARNKRFLADDIALPANTPAQAKSLLHSLERAAGGIDIHVNADETDFVCFNQRGNICSLNGMSLKLEDKFTYLKSSVSSMKNDINMRLANVWTAVDRLSVIWKPDLSDKIKHIFFQLRTCQYYYMDAPNGRWLSVWRKNLTAITQGYYELYWTNPEGNIPQKSSGTTTYHTSRRQSKLDKRPCWTLLRK